MLKKYGHFTRGREIFLSRLYFFASRREIFASGRVVTPELLNP